MRPMPIPISMCRALLQVCVAMMWSVSVFAVEPALVVVPTLADLPIRALGAALFLAVTGGAARTAQKLADPQTQVTSVRMTIFADVLTSIAVGMATFFLVAWREFHASTSFHHYRRRLWRQRIPRNLRAEHRSPFKWRCAQW